MSLAQAGNFDSVVAPLDVYVRNDAGARPASDPRRTEAYRAQILDAVGLGEDLSDTYAHLSPDDVAMCRDVIARRAAAFWIDGGPRTMIRGFLHLIVKGGPVRQPPHRLKGDDLQFVEDSLQPDLRRGQLSRGRSEWGTPAFPTKPGKRKRWVVIDCRKLNAITEKASFLIPFADDIKEQMSAAWWYTAADAVSGFNHVRNTPEARMVLAIVSASGRWLPEALVFGPTNGPEYFQYVVYRAFGESLDSAGSRRLLRDWNIYIDDFAVATRRCFVLAGNAGAARDDPSVPTSGPRFSSDPASDGPSVRDAPCVPTSGPEFPLDPAGDGPGSALSWQKGQGNDGSYTAQHRRSKTLEGHIAPRSTSNTDVCSQSTFQFHALVTLRAGSNCELCTVLRDDFGNAAGLDC